ncbi:SOS regulatory protein LexA [Clostridium cavendishii DSM 21758]|uniref:SOS regulatory protein LexA n=1 Tax=Clostridium cavendishii DSM 21758 TaxID=1121302 RepID=A0A1M6VLM8_9CLOT|nr:LexA family transcriptional regulator [Clostridium cavendishii]SHK82146.1 SOS regulatory protein LexA [Clostridium cavendishii DSM 21758]
MNFEGNQKKFLNLKSLGFQVLKGAESTGKTTIAMHRVVKLANNYCLYMDEKIAVISNGEKSCKEAMNIYSEAKERVGESFYSLFSTDEERVRVLDLNSLINIYSKAYEKSFKMELKIASEDEKMELLKPLILEKIEGNKKNKLLVNNNEKFVLKEIEWIKACNFNKEEYFVVERKGRTKRLNKNSITRNIIFDLMLEYSLKLNNLGLKDEYDDVIFALKQTKRVKDKFTHIVMDNLETLTKAEIDFVKRLYENKDYSSFIFIINNNECDRENIWLKKGRKISTLNTESKLKSIVLKNQFKKEKIQISSMETYEFHDLKHKRIVTFVKDSASVEKEILVQEDDTSYIYEENELIDIPMYNDIAAGEPILISSEQESIFNLPSNWFKGSKETFILHVKGDSMKNANINDGDLVVIKKQSTALHNEIVAADIEGSATLKRLNLKSKIPYLMPENPKYFPISLEDKEASILGVAIGIIKNKN